MGSCRNRKNNFYVPFGHIPQMLKLYHVYLIILSLCLETHGQTCFVSLCFFGWSV